MIRDLFTPTHLLIVAVVAMVLFGAKRLPDTARQLGKSMRILKAETKALKDETPPGEQRTVAGEVLDGANTPAAERQSAEAR
ncbi:Sec-independent protein translocase subunit TatA [Streptantibioticus rubrisoli]|uniref:Sec-independent protein translocase protein TatA n=1 Tax=Streptantibioticus rubrisoli TaxID=1387313 RepID=A0ABT1PEU8_9ACTN|nr:Sec-independent protein translocase subunit TatA [Streptantibioticus rubrisoli]MCQ4043901.1 Sec-independent protein translocase subunit TatA [Streptantibioticus rubrisoli]